MISKFFYSMGLLFLSINALCQKIIVIDTITKSPIEGVSITINNKFNFLTNSYGKAEILKVNNLNDIEISHISYQLKNLKALKLKDTIYLSPKTIELGEVIISNVKSKEINSKLLKRKNSFKNFIVFNNNEILAQIIPSNTICGFKIKELHLIIDKNIKDDNIKDDLLIMIQISIYDNNKNLELSNKNSVFSITKKINPKKFEHLVIDLNEENINLTQNGFIIGFKNLGYISENGSTLNDKCLVRIAMTSNKSSLYEENTFFKWSNNKITSSKDVMEKMYQADKNIQKDTQDNLNFGMVLSNKNQ